MDLKLQITATPRQLELFYVLVERPPEGVDQDGFRTHTKAVNALLDHDGFGDYHGVLRETKKEMGKRILRAKAGARTDRDWLEVQSLEALLELKVEELNDKFGNTPITVRLPDTLGEFLVGQFKQHKKFAPDEDSREVLGPLLKAIEDRCYAFEFAGQWYTAPNEEAARRQYQQLKREHEPTESPNGEPAAPAEAVEVS